MLDSSEIKTNWIRRPSKIKEISNTTKHCVIALFKWEDLLEIFKIGEKKEVALLVAIQYEQHYEFGLKLVPNEP